MLQKVKARNLAFQFGVAIWIAASFLLPAEEKVWVGTVSTDWFEGANWDPPGVPEPHDAAMIIVTNMVVISSNIYMHSMLIGGPHGGAVVIGAGNITITNLVWTNGTIHGTGALFIPSFGELVLEQDSLKVLGRNVYVDGSLFLRQGTLRLGTVGALTIHNNGTFKLENNSAINYRSEYGNVFVNRGVVEASSLRTNKLTVNLESFGEFRIRSGTLHIEGLVQNHGILEVSEGAILRLNRDCVLTEGSAIAGNGLIQVATGNVRIGTTNVIEPHVEIGEAPYNPAVTFLASGSMNKCTFTRGSISMTNTMTFRHFEWRGGDLLGGVGLVRIVSEGKMRISGSGLRFFGDATLLNEGEVEWVDDARIGRTSFDNRTEIVNKGMFHVRGNGWWVMSRFGGFLNEGLFIRSGSTGACGFGLFFTNTGRLEVHGGTLGISGDQLQGETLLYGGHLAGGTWKVRGGKVEGVGTFSGHPSYGNLVNIGGVVNPGNPLGSLNVAGFNQYGGQLNIEIGGVIQGSEYDSIMATGAVRVSSTLDVQLVNGFRPNVGNSFEILRFVDAQQFGIGPDPGSFSEIKGSDLGNGLMLWPVYTRTNVVLW